MQILTLPKTKQGFAFGKFVSLLWFIAHFSLLPPLLKSIWPTLLKIPDPLFPMAITTSIVTAVFSLYNLVMYFVYVKKIPFFQQYRVCHKPWLWESNVEEWKKLIKKTFMVVLLNSYILMPIGYLIQYVLIKQQYAKSMQLWPSTFTIFWQSMFFLLMEDFGFFWSHYLLHKTRLYKYHKIHHEHVMTVTIGASYAHPIQALLSNALPGILGAVILSKFTTVHYVSIAVWFVFGLVETCEAHSGYEWSWRQLSFFPWKMGPQYHSFHHQTYSENIGSIFIFWDNIMKTNEKYLTIKEQKRNS